MRKALTYSSFAIIGAIVIFAFLTAKTYSQLAVASLLYIPVAYFAFIIFQRLMGERKMELTMVPVTKPEHTHKPPPSKTPSGDAKLTAEVVDIDRRAFLKIIGATGLSVFLFSLWGRRIESFLFGGRSLDSVGVPTGGDGGALPLQASPTDGFKISEIDDSEVSYYGFTNQKGAWFIMKEDLESGSFRYSKGDADFARNWLNRQNLKYNYFHELF